MFFLIFSLRNLLYLTMKKYGGLRRESGYFTGFFGVNLAGLGSRVDSGFM